MEVENVFDRCINLTDNLLQLQKRQSRRGSHPLAASNEPVRNTDTVVDTAEISSELENCIQLWYRKNDPIRKCNNDEEWHPIHLASLLERIDFISVIIAEEPDAVNSKYISKSDIITPLMCAAAAGSLETMQFLVNHGATFSENPLQELEWAIIGKSVGCFYFVVSRARFRMSLRPIEIIHLFVMGLLEDDPKIFKAIINLPKKFSQSVHSEKTMQVSQLIIIAYSEILCLTLRKAYVGVLEVLLKENCIPEDFELYGDIPALHFVILNHNDDKVGAKLLKVLLQYGAPVNQVDNQGKTALSYASSRGFQECFFALVRAEAEINVEDMKNMSERIPNFFKLHLDNLISSNSLTSSPSGEFVSIDIRFMGVIKNGNDQQSSALHLAEEQKFREICFLVYIIEDGQEEFILHPVIQTYLEKKWTRFFKAYFLVSYALYLLQLLCFTHHVWIFYASNEDSNITSNCAEAISIETKMPSYDEMDLPVVTGGNNCIIHELLFLVISFIGSWSLVVTRIWSFICAILLHSFKSQLVQRTYEIFLVTTAILSISPTVLSSWLWEDPKELQRAAASIAVLLAWCYCLFYLARHWSLGIYVEMLGKIHAITTTLFLHEQVLKNFVIFLLTYICFLVGYALSFSILYKGAKPFHTILTTAKEMVKMMLAESDVDQELKSDLPSLTNMFYISFIVTVTIALINLLIGLAVHDIQGLINTSKLNKSIRQIRYMHLVESVVYSGRTHTSFCIPMVLQQCLMKRMRHDDEAIVNIYPNTPQHRRRSFAREALEIARRNSQTALD